MPAGQQPDTDAEWRQPAAQGLEVLLGEDFRGRHEGRLAAVFRGTDGGESRDHGFSGTDVALEQTHHRPSA